jgi:GntP family gluconate:H+ symporter
MAAGLYAVHCFIPPHPGVTAATGTLGADVGRVILYGLIVAVPAMLAGYFWATWKGKKFPEVAGDEEDSGTSVRNENLPGALVSFIPVVVPILLIAVRAVLSNLPSVKDTWMAPVLITGDPSIALIIGLILALCIPKRWEKNELGKLMHQGIEKAGGILIIIGAGSAFGAVISALKIQDYLAEMEGLNTLGIFFPFLIALILKTAQGSSTVAISHVNDAYFWVITNFSNQALKPMLRVYSLATICMAVTGILAVYILSLFIL